MPLAENVAVGTRFRSVPVIAGDLSAGGSVERTRTSLSAWILFPERKGCLFAVFIFFALLNRLRSHSDGEDKLLGGVQNCLYLLNFF